MASGTQCGEEQNLGDTVCERRVLLAHAALARRAVCATLVAMDLIGVCALSLVLHVLVNRFFGHLRGWLRVWQCPTIFICAMLGHGAAVFAPTAWLLALLAHLSGTSMLRIDFAVSAVAACCGIYLARRIWPRLG